MKKLTNSSLMFFVYVAAVITAAAPLFGQERNKMKKLSKEEERVIVHKGTEKPFTGKYYKHDEKGIYACKRCGAHLFSSDDKFDSGCGWPSFDDEIPGAVNRQPDTDGIRTEITCANCGAHLGHVFLGERLTEKNLRHCVNSISMDFIPSTESKIDSAIFAGGCFWGVEYFLKQSEGVISTATGYTGGKTDNPTYKEVCSGETGHIEAVRVTFDSGKISYEELAKLFFETHDPTQLNRQGPDIGEQYSSVIFYKDENQKKTAEKLISILEKKGYDIATELREASEFWEAEDYHQDYYERGGSRPYCHIYEKKF